MKKLLIILAFFAISLSSVGQEWISNGESGYSVRTKLNNFHTYVTDTLAWNIHKIDSVLYPASDPFYLSDTCSFVWIQAGVDDDFNDTIFLPAAADWMGRIYTIMVTPAEDTVVVYCQNAGDELYFISSGTSSPGYLFKGIHTGIIQVISTGDRLWMVMRLEDYDLTP